MGMMMMGVMFPDMSHVGKRVVLSEFQTQNSAQTINELQCIKNPK